MVLHPLCATICLLLLWTAGTQALDVRGQISWNDVCSNATALGRAKVVLDSGSEHATSVTKSGGFLVSNVPVGSYILSVITHDFVFDQLRIDVHNLSDPDPEVRPYIAGTPLNPPSGVLLPYPIVLSAKHQFNYFSTPESFNVVSMLSNPMTLMMVFGGIMMFAAPYIMNNLDPEALGELKEQRARVAGAQNAIASGDFKSGISSMMASGEEARASQESLSSQVNKTPQKASKGAKRTKR